MKKSFWIFQNGDFFSGKTAFLQISADFGTGLEKFITTISTIADPKEQQQKSNA